MVLPISELPDKMSEAGWFLYALRCADDTLYTGVTTNLSRRLRQHNAGRGARYTSGRRPVHLIGAWPFENQSAAQQAEARFRRLPRRQKLQLIAQKAPVSGSPFYSDATITDELGQIRFCPHCGGLLKVVERIGDDRPRSVCTVCGRVNYRNAKPCAGILVVKQGRLLLVKRAIEPYRGHWDIPGGFLEVDELPCQGAVREVQEETGLRVQISEFFGFYTGRYDYGHSRALCLNIYFIGRVAGGSEQAGDDAADLAWFRPEELPGAIAFDHAQQVLDDWSEWMKGKQERS
jgi:predicted GIY-YIG superfamily endonuclease/ADP-ribose pyrophosphatase YjhB (NUDIX family)